MPEPVRRHGRLTLYPGQLSLDHWMEVVMARAKQQIRETETNELSEAELSQVSAGIIAVLQQKAQMCDGSVRPVAASQNALIGLL
jgi:hypothetical protein